MSSPERTIRALEKEINEIKLLHQLEKFDHESAKREIKRLELELLNQVKLLPEHKRHIYAIRKEFGKEF